jgi:hypothetical protein
MEGDWRRLDSGFEALYRPYPDSDGCRSLSTFTKRFLSLRRSERVAQRNSPKRNARADSATGDESIEFEEIVQLMAFRRLFALWRLCQDTDGRDLMASPVNSRPQMNTPVC